MKPERKKKIAIAFSNGEFKDVYDHIDEEIVWEVVGENVFKGKKAVVDNCEQTASYFDSVETNFKTDDVRAFGNEVVVRGSAEFKKDGKRLNFIKACDIYKFDDNGKILNIYSYCIPMKE